LGYPGSFCFFFSLEGCHLKGVLLIVVSIEEAH